MIRTKTIFAGFAMLAAYLFAAQDAQAGPLLDWLRGRRPTGNNYQQQQPAYNYYGTQMPVSQYATPQNAMGLQPGQCMKTCQKTCTRTVVNYVPYTAYRTSWKRVPVTTYRPVTNSDPCTGCTVTCMRPCTTYTYQMQRVPYTTQRPVYRTETYKVPVTTITNDCATGACNTGCSTCGTSTYQGAPVQGFAPPTPASVNDGSNFQTPSFPTEPANVAPSILSGETSSNVSPGGILNTGARYNTVGRTRTSQRPQVSIPRNLRSETSHTSSARSPVQRDWNYSPIRLASFQQELNNQRVPVRPVRKQRTSRSRNSEVNGFWKDVN